MMRPFFSFIIPVYNVEDYLAECIESVLNQSFQDYEIILVNDGSTDNSLNVCKYYQEKDARIKVLTKPNAGLSHTRNKGLDNAQGKYIFFLDGDDHLEKKGFSLSEIYKQLQENDIDIFMFDLIRFSVNQDASYYLYDNNSRNNIFFIDGLLEIFSRELYVTSACNKIIKKSLIEAENLRFPIGMLSEDFSWCADLLKNSLFIRYSNIELYFYRQNREGSIMAKMSRKHIMDIYKQLDSLSKDFKGDANEYLKRYLSLNYLNCLRLMCIHDDFSIYEIKNLMQRMDFYLNYNGYSKINFLRFAIKVMGFKSIIRLLVLYFRVVR